MRILVVHAWLRGNLGDVLQLSVLLSALRALRPRVLDLEGYPARPPSEAMDVVSRCDRYMADPFVWAWRASPSLLGNRVIEPYWRARRQALFLRYDAIVCAPGAYLADYDARAPSALHDLVAAAELGRPVVLSSHSIGPLTPEGLAAVARASARIAREPSTHEYLRDQGISCRLSADLAFLYPYADVPVRQTVDAPYRVLFLRANNLDAGALRLEGQALYEGGRLIAGPSPDRLVLATSDPRRDDRFLATAARRLGIPWVACRSVAELVQLVRGASAVVSDRYHPAICGAALGKPVHVLPNREPHKMHGLASLLSDRTFEELQDLTRAGLNALSEALGRVD
jgi:polysaccharide pyruvyl transferase WcaK-like protein